MKKGLVFISILLIFSGVVFFIGWTQMYVPSGSYGILSSKTNGIDPQPVVSGAFRWHWQRLLPTNTTLFIFKPIPFKKDFTFSGTLPSSELYSKLLEGSPRFGWECTVAITGIVDPATVPLLIEKNTITNQTELDDWVHNRLRYETEQAITKNITDVMGESRLRDIVLADQKDMEDYLSETLVPILRSYCQETEIRVTSFKRPDLELYELAKSMYFTYLEEKEARMTGLAKEQADQSSADYLEMERLSKMGEILTRYPILIDYLAVTKDDEGATFKALRQSNQRP